MKLYRTAEQERQRTKTFETTLKITLEEKQKPKTKAGQCSNVILVIVEERQRNVKRNPYHVSSCHVAAGITGGRALATVSPIAVASLAGKVQDQRLWMGGPSFNSCQGAERRG